MSRRLPTAAEAAAILARKRTRPPIRSTPTAGRALAKFIRELDARFGQGTGALNARWREIVGEPIARRTEPSKLVKGRQGGAYTLEIRVDGPSASLIQHQSADIIERVNLFLGAGAVEKLRIVQGPVKARPAAPVAGRPRVRSAPLDAAQEAELETSLEAAPEGKLRDALRQLGRNAMKAKRR
ncbi:MAG TPA: DciA family protein [Caulobacteraceae bacterium]|nr:DciA family protein [Caulobacteraceae bacterium]